MSCARATRFVQLAAMLATLLVRPAIGGAQTIAGVRTADGGALTIGGTQTSIGAQTISDKEAEDAARAPRLAGLLNAARRSLRASGVPVLLPSRVPAVVDPVRSIAIVLADPSGYIVAFSPVSGCDGAQSCATFDIAGYAAPAHEAARLRDRHLRLADGTSALFRPQDCSGASCTASSLFFERDGTLYEIDARTGRSDRGVLAAVYQSLHLVLGTTVSAVKRER